MVFEPKLLALSGPLRGREFDCSPNHTTIGRAPECEVVIDHLSVSRQHCTVVQHGGTFSVEDRGSRNGTLLNGERITATALQHGDRIQAGISTFIFLTKDEDLASILSDVRVSEDAFDASAFLQIAYDETLYLHPERVLTGADAATIRNFNALLRLGATLRASDTLAGLEEQALEIIMGAIPAETGAILLTGSSHDQLLSSYVRSHDGSNCLTVSRSVVGHVLNSRAALLTNDATRSVPNSRTLVQSETQSVLCVPLMTGNKAFGVIYLASGFDATPFERQQLELLTAMGAMLGLPLESVRRVEWLECEHRRLRAEINEDRRLIGDSEAMEHVLGFIARVAPTDSTVLLRGESGTGKELIAHSIHRSSRRAKAPFVPINCALLRSELLATELFGHEKGAFTSAIASKRGKLEMADGGTLFLDEVGELIPDVQAKLLRVLQERQFERVGGTATIQVDVRVIAATNMNLEDAVRRGGFRQDLYYRLNVVSIESPALRLRGRDSVNLARHFAARYAARYNSSIRGLSTEAELCIVSYDWPGNVRELQNAIERAVVLGEADMILPEDLPEAVAESGPSAPAGSTARADSPRYHEAVKEAKRRILESALRDSGGNHAEAARRLGVNRTYLHRLIRSVGLKES